MLVAPLGRLRLESYYSKLNSYPGWSGESWFIIAFGDVESSEERAMYILGCAKRMYTFVCYIKF